MKITEKTGQCVLRYLVMLIISRTGYWLTCKYTTTCKGYIVKVAYALLIVIITIIMADTLSGCLVTKLSHATAMRRINVH